MRRPFIAGNWKMNTTREEAGALANAVVQSTRNAVCDIALCVPFPYLQLVRDITRSTQVQSGAQDVYWEPRGAFTGQVSVAMLEDYCDYVIIGHSERRQLFGETDETVNRKLKAVLESTLDPIVCVGESVEERRRDRTIAVLKRQLQDGLQGAEVSERMTIAYEPIWAIGTGETATPKQAQDACAFVRAFVGEMFGYVADRIRIQYGGSVNAENAAELLSQPDIDGALVGGASLKADQFAVIVGAAGK